MYQAEENAMAQKANNDIVEMRMLEISYFRTFFSNIGTQAILIMALTQLPNVQLELSSNMKMLLWVCVTITFYFCANVLVSTVFLSVYGEGLALRGPEGSMVRAVKIMVTEQSRIARMFIGAVFTMTLMAISIYWLQMPPAGAAITTGITLGGMYMWYNSCVRIYNRFKMKDRKKVDWVTEADEGDDDPAIALQVITKKKNTESPGEQKEGNNSDSDSGSSDGGQSIIVTKKKSKQSSKKNESNPNDDAESDRGSSISSVTDNDSEADRSSRRDSVNTVSSRASSTRSSIFSPTANRLSLFRRNSEVVTNNLPVVDIEPTKEAADSTAAIGHQGYLLLYQKKKTFTSSEYKRLFVVIDGKKLKYYKDKNDWIRYPEKRLKSRPLDLQGHTLQLVGTSSPIYLRLSSSDREAANRGVIEFKCDTMVEALSWIEVLKRAIA